MGLTTYVAIYGAILSTIAIGVHIYNAIQDRPKIKVTAKFGFFGYSKGVSETFFFVKAINKGRRSVHLSSVGLRGEKGDLINIHTISLPFELKEGKSHREWFKPEELKNRKLDFAWYLDETGKMYKSKSIRKKLEDYFKSERKAEIEKVK